MNRSVNEYEYRNRVIGRMGYGSYCHYLRSGLWRQIRRTVLVDNPLCVVCRKLATQVHHRTYTAHNLTGITTDGLVAMCEKCHSAIEHDECGRKLFGGDVDRKLETMLADAEHVRTHGMKRPKAREAVKRCTDCGKEIKRDRLRCRACGKKTGKRRKRKRTQTTRPTHPSRPK